MSEISEEVADIQSLLSESESRIEELRDEIEEKKAEVEDILQEQINPEDIDEELLKNFIEKPYITLPRDEGEMWVVVPRFIPFNVGWLQKQTESYNAFVVNKYVSWLNDLPDDIQSRLPTEEKFSEAYVDDGILHVGSEDEREEAWDSYNENLYQRKGETEIKINKGREFEVIADLVEDGHLPFTPNPVTDDDLRSEPSDVSLRSYQQRAFERFKETGHVGVFWPPGSGKTFLSLYTGDYIEGEKLVVVPSRTLKEQWENRIEEFTRYPEEWSVETYQYFNYGDNLEEYQEKDIAFLLMDELHHLPAPTFSKIATIGSKFRMGLSATPYREDDKENYIFALSGEPIGLNWDELMSLGVVTEPSVYVYLYRTERQKKSDLDDILSEQTGKKTIIFCDSLEKGEQLSERLGVPFISGETTNRIEKFNENQTVISSRVGDEGLSVDDVDTVIEYDFHGGSRRQELQRVGRVMHNSENEGKHIIMMTDEELEKHEKRLYGIEEKGINLKFTRRD